MTECVLPDVRQHQDIVFPQRMHADSRRALEIEGCARDGDAGESQFLVPSYQSLVTSHFNGQVSIHLFHIGIAAFIL